MKTIINTTEMNHIEVKTYFHSWGVGYPILFRSLSDMDGGDYLSDKIAGGCDLNSDDVRELLRGNAIFKESQSSTVKMVFDVNNDIIAFTIVENREGRAYREYVSLKLTGDEADDFKDALSTVIAIGKMNGR